MKNSRFPTPYEEVNTAVTTLLENVRAVLGDEFIGMYLYGSIAIGGFDPGRSDIDFLVITAQSLKSDMMKSLRDMHLRLWEKALPWVDKIEGVYVPYDEIGDHELDCSECLMINEKQFATGILDTDWVLNRYILNKHGVTVSGPPIQSLVKPVSTDRLKETIKAELKIRWTKFLYDKELLTHQGYQSFIVITMCRVMYTLVTGDIPAKDKAAEWALENLDSEWHVLIYHAIKWQYGVPSGDIGETRRFMRYVMNKAGEITV